MRFATTNLGHAGFCVALWLFGALSVSAQGCGDAYGFYECITEESTYTVRTPEAVDPNYRFPVVVVLHDAGGSGADIVDDERLIEAFIEKGFAVLAPDAQRRSNLRFRYGASKAHAQSPLRRGMTTDSYADFRRNKAKFAMTDADGSVRKLDYQKDTGWYFYNIDVAIFKGLRTETEYLGRDEIGFLRDALDDAAEKRGIDPEPVLIIGLGHGGSLVWQIACHAPELGRILAPVGGAYWRKLPENCSSGANLVHTHHRDSPFWPLAGVEGNKKRFARTSIYRNLEMLLSANRCETYNTPDRKDELDMSHTVWADCAIGGPVEFMLLDDPFAFQDWWLDEMLYRLELTGIERPFEEVPEAPVATGPQFETPGADAELEAPDTRTGFKTPGARTGFKRPGAGTRFKAPDTDTNTRSRFKRAK